MITEMDIIDFLNVTMRWLHISSMTVLVGGLLFLWIGFGEGDGAVSSRAAGAYRPLFFFAAALVLISGIYNFIYKMNHTVLSPAYHAIFGIKFLLVLHVLAAGFLATRTSNPKRRRQAAGAAITGFTILLLSAVLRKLSM
jgi:putative copper export protein